MDWKGGAVKGWIALTNLGVFAVAGTIIGFWYSIGDRAADRHQNAWQVVRDAISWSDRGGTGNLGQVNAIETLTRDCDKPWLLRTSLGHFFQDCLPMKSIRLTKMDLRDLNASGADFEDGFFSCSNFDRTKLIGTKLRNARLKWASLRHADLTKADLTGACLFRADVAGAKFSDDVDRNMLKEACILKQDGQQQRTELNTNSQGLAEFSKQIPNCDGPYRCQNDLWDCLSPNDSSSSESPTGLSVP
jgi:Pentapeptide repeats (8 copies)